MENNISYEFTRLELEDYEFDNLVFMGPPPIWEKYPDDHEFLLELCFKPLKEVAQIVKQKSHILKPSKSPQNATEVFKRLHDANIKPKDEDQSWFRRHMLLSENFHKELMGSLWIRNLANYPGGEKDKCPDGSFYIEDGNHRALVYAMMVAFDETYEDVEALHATSWDIADGILGHPCQPTQALDRDGKFPADGGTNIKKRIHSYKSGFHAPIKLFESF